MGAMACLANCASDIGLRENIIQKLAFHPPKKGYKI